MSYNYGTRVLALIVSLSSIQVLHVAIFHPWCLLFITSSTLKTPCREQSLRGSRNEDLIMRGNLPPPSENPRWDLLAWERKRKNFDRDSIAITLVGSSKAYRSPTHQQLQKYILKQEQGFQKLLIAFSNHFPTNRAAAQVGSCLCTRCRIYTCIDLHLLQIPLSHSEKNITLNNSL